jgi:TolB-like protein
MPGPATFVPVSSPHRTRLGAFELDLTSGELNKSGQTVTLPPKALEVLKALLEQPGEVVTRAELRRRLWPANTFVEFDDSLNHAVKRLRQALGDSADEPEFIETLPRYGYRLMTCRDRPVEPAPKIRSLAVLPLTALSCDREQEFFADGMTDALIAELSTIRGVKVISRTSVMRYKGAKKPLPQIARELRVDGVIEGTVQHSSERVRVRVHIIHAATDNHVWAGGFERDSRDIFNLQGEVVRAISREIKAALPPDVSPLLAPAHPGSPDAYEAYLKGKFHWYKLSPGHLDRALSYFQFALEKDPNYAPAHVGTADVWLVRADAGFVPPCEAFPKARAAVLRALELDEKLAEGHMALANVMALYEWDWSAGEREFRLAIELNLNSAEAHFMYADFLISMRRSEEWAAEMKRVLELDPLNPFFQCFYGWHLVYLDQCDDAIPQLLEAVAADPSFASARMGLWGAFYRKGLHEDALAEAEKFFAVLGDNDAEDALRRGYAEGGYSRAMHFGAEVLTRRSRRCHVPSMRVARLYAHAGENDQAMEWLRRAFEQRESPLMHLGVAWDWDALRDDVRFQELLRGVGLPE